jgi:hypothetical protein
MHVRTFGEDRVSTQIDQLCVPVPEGIQLCSRRLGCVFPNVLLNMRIYVTVAETW